MFSQIKVNSAARRRGGRGGFTFTEILFAVMILGIGFIMVAAMFPVALKQTQESVEETTAGCIAAEAGSYVNRLATANPSPVYPQDPTHMQPRLAQGYSPAYFTYTFGRVAARIGYPIWDGGAAVGGTDPTSPAGFGASPPLSCPPMSSTSSEASFWDALSGNLIYPTDTRYAWVPLYSRNVDPPYDGLKMSPYAVVTMIVVQSRNTSNFTKDDLLPLPIPAPPASAGSIPASMCANLQARSLLAQFTLGGTGPDYVHFFYDTPTFPASGTMPPAVGVPAWPPFEGYVGIAPDVVAEGTYVVVADDSLTALYKTSMEPRVSCNGFIYKVGNRHLDSLGSVGTDTWDLIPGNDMKSGRYSPCTSEPTGSSQLVRVYVVGRGFNNPASKDVSLLGPAMDIAAFSTVVKALP